MCAVRSCSPGFASRSRETWCPENAAAVPQRLAPAAALATRCGARLTGFFASGFPVMAAYGDVSGWEQLVDAYLDAQRREAAAAAAAFRQALTKDKLAGEWIFRETDETASAIAEAALHDLVVVGQPNPDAGLTGAIGLRPEEIVLGCGRPVLVVPYAGEFPDVGRRILVAWNGSRESSRALHDAMFLLPDAEAVTVIEIDPPASGMAADLIPRIVEDRLAQQVDANHAVKDAIAAVL